MKDNDFGTKYAEYLGQQIKFLGLVSRDEDWHIQADTITFENVDYDYFSIQADDLFAEKSDGSDMYYANCKQSYENICRNYKFGY